MTDRGAYVIYLRIKQSFALSVGSIGDAVLPAGRYAYVGSACRGIAARIARHRRLAMEKTGKLHWHVDHVLVHPEVEWIGCKAFVGESECEISRKIASRNGVSVPVPHFGSSDCRSGCRAHFYRLGRNGNRNAWK